MHIRSTFTKIFAIEPAAQNKIGKIALAVALTHYAGVIFIIGVIVVGYFILSIQAVAQKDYLVVCFWTLPWLLILASPPLAIIISIAGLIIDKQTRYAFVSFLIASFSILSFWAAPYLIRILFWIFDQLRIF